jgi:hypothetical protein
MAEFLHSRYCHIRLSLSYESFNVLVEGSEPIARIHTELNLITGSVTITDSSVRNCGRTPPHINTGYIDMHFKLTAYSTVV